MRKSKKFVSLGLAAMLSAGLLTGCGSTSTQAQKASEVETVAEEVIETSENNINFDNFETAPETKTFEPNTHLIVTKIPLNTWKYESASLEIPDGYEFVGVVEDFYNTGGKIGTQEVTGFYILIVNTKTVEVKPHYNESTDSYDYSAPGTVVELEDSYSLTK